MTSMTVEERRQSGRVARKAVSRSSHGAWVPAPTRPDPVALLEEQNQTRVPWLVPIRHLRMGVSPFTFYRGSARIMAADLADTPTSGLDVQLGGDAHLSNFGAYASPERQLVFDANDFDETLRGPWEWDLKRLAASFTIAAGHLGFSAADRRSVTTAAVRAYREGMDRFAKMGTLDLWYDHVSVNSLYTTTGVSAVDMAKRLDRFERKARRRTSLQALQKLAEPAGGHYRIRSDPPVLYAVRDLPGDVDRDVIDAAAREAFEQYKTTVADDRRFLLDRFEVVDVGLKVVGVGSVGTRCLILLLEGRDADDALFLQAKEASASVLEEHLEPSPYENHGRRVVEGQRLVQAEADIFLGWTKGSIDGRDFYVRQLRDWKGSAEVEGSTPEQLRFYARICGHTMARGHARSGDAVAIRAYVGSSDTLDRSMAEFSEAYAAQNLEDYTAFRQAIADGRLPVATSG
jgi:uncharacterized protein (DUF2252 family)